MRYDGEITLSAEEAKGILNALRPDSAEFDLLSQRLCDLNFGLEVTVIVKSLLAELTTMEEARRRAYENDWEVALKDVPEEEVQREYDHIVMDRTNGVMNSLDFKDGRFSWRPFACPQYLKDPDKFLAQLGELVNQGSAWRK